MGGLTRSPRLRIVALVVGSLAGLAMIVVGCTSVTEGAPKVNRRRRTPVQGVGFGVGGGVGRIVQRAASPSGGSR